MTNRLTLRRKLSYNTKSNKRIVSKTPGNKLVYLYPKKKANPVKCGDCKKPLQGIVKMRPNKMNTVSKRQKTVTRAYGGSRCATCVKHRILQAFFLDEYALVKIASQKMK